MAAGRLLVDTLVEPSRLSSAAVDRGMSGVAGEVRRELGHALDVNRVIAGNLIALDPQARAERYLHELHDDGAWATAEDVSRDTGEQVPTVALLAAGLGAG